MAAPSFVEDAIARTPRGTRVSIRERVACVLVKKVPRRLHQRPQEVPVAELIELPRRRDRDTRKKCSRILEIRHPQGGAESIRGHADGWLQVEQACVEHLAWPRRVRRALAPTAPTAIMRSLQTETETLQPSRSTSDCNY